MIKTKRKLWTHKHIKDVSCTACTTFSGPPCIHCCVCRTSLALFSNRVRVSYTGYHSSTACNEWFSSPMIWLSWWWLNRSVLFNYQFSLAPTGYDTIRDAILRCAQKLTWVSLIYHTEPTTKKWKTEKAICSEVSVTSELLWNVKQDQNAGKSRVTECPSQKVPKTPA